MNPLLKHTLSELDKQNANHAYVIGTAFISLLEQAQDNPNINLNGGEKAYKSAKKKAKKVSRSFNKAKRAGKAYLDYLTK